MTNNGFKKLDDRKSLGFNVSGIIWGAAVLVIAVLLLLEREEDRSFVLSYINNKRYIRMLFVFASIGLLTFLYNLIIILAEGITTVILFAQDVFSGKYKGKITLSAAGSGIKGIFKKVGSVIQDYREDENAWLYNCLLSIPAFFYLFLFSAKPSSSADRKYFNEVLEFLHLSSGANFILLCCAVFGLLVPLVSIFRIFCAIWDHSPGNPIGKSRDEQRKKRKR